jgi:PKD repeat protein
MTTETLPNGIVSVSYSVNPATGSNITLSVESGELPPGLEIGYNSFGGTPTEAGTYTFTAKAENSGGSDTKEFTIVIEALQSPVITATTLPNGKVGFYEDPEAVIGATGFNITWSIVSGPSWLEFLVPPSNRNFIIISGTPTEAGTYTFTVKAENAAGNDTKEFTIVIETWPPPVITTTTLPNGEVNVYYYYANIEATYFIDRITWSVDSGELPPGLQLFDDDISIYNRGIIKGTPTQTGTYTFTVKAENAYGSDMKEFTIVIEALQPPVITTTTLPNGAVGVFYAQSILVDGSNITWSVESGELPPGLELSTCFNGGCNISGTPTEIGTHTFTVKAENAAGSDTKEFTIVIEELLPPVITTTTLPNDVKGVSYYAQIDATGFDIAWSVVSGNFPSWLELYRSGFIFGRYPTEIGTHTFTVKAENAAGSDTKEFTIVIDEEPVVPVSTHQIASANKAVQTHNGINLTTANNATLEIYGIKGNLISRRNFASGVHAVSLGHLPKGMYIAKVSFGNGKQILRVPVR